MKPDYLKPHHRQLEYQQILEYQVKRSRPIVIRGNIVYHWYCMFKFYGYGPVLVKYWIARVTRTAPTVLKYSPEQVMTKSN